MIKIIIEGIEYNEDELKENFGRMEDLIMVRDFEDYLSLIYKQYDVEVM